MSLIADFTLLRALLFSFYPFAFLFDSSRRTHESTKLQHKTQRDKETEYEAEAEIETETERSNQYGLRVKEEKQLKVLL